MGTELSFLIELLLNHDLPKPTKDLIASRIKEVEHNLTTTTIYAPTTHQLQNIPPQLKQAPSTLAAMARHGELPQSILTGNESIVMPPVENTAPVQHIAQNAITAAALNSRQEAIAQGMAGKVDKATGGKRKW